MAPTLLEGDRWFVSTSIGELKRGDIIEFRYPKDESKHYIKRIIALPGERIEIREGTVLINGTPITEDYVDQRYNHSTYMPEELVQENRYFVMGDNRANSSDSRYWGTVDRSLIEGKLHIRYIAGKER